MFAVSAEEAEVDSLLGGLLFVKFIDNTIIDHFGLDIKDGHEALFCWMLAGAVNGDLAPGADRVGDRLHQPG